MRLRRLRLENYGCFERTELCLATEPGRLNLVIAPNGAGKSLLRQAFHDLLFDIPLQSAMKFRFGYAGMALHAEAVAADGTPFDFGWVRGAKPPRITSDEARFAELRASATPRQLEQLYALDTRRLREGGTDLQGGESLAGALLSGTGELARPRKIRAEIEARRLANWGQGKRTPPLNRALSDLAESRKRVRAAMQRPQHREQQERELEAQREAHQAARAAQQAAKAETRRLYRIELTRPHLQALAEAEAWFAANPDAPALPHGLEEPLAEARAAMTQARTERDLAAKAVDSAHMEAERIVRDTGTEAHTEALAGLPERLGEAEKAATDSVAVRAKRDAVHQQIQATLRDIGATVPLAEAGSLVPDVALRAEARLLIDEVAKRDTALARANTNAAEATRQLREAEQSPAETTQVPDGLATLLAEILADRKPGQHEAELREEARKAAARMESLLARVPGWTAGAAALRALPVPADAVLERLHAEHIAAATASRNATAARDTLRRRQADIAQALDELRQRALPDDAAIAAARARRDDGWRLIFRRAFSGRPPDEDAERDYTAGATLPAAFEHAIRAADALADQRITELDRVSEADRLTRDLSQGTDALAAAEAEAAACTTIADAARHAWAQAVHPLGLAADDGLRVAQQILTARLAVIDALEAVDVSRNRLDHLAATHTAWAKRLAALLTTDTSTNLASLVATAEARLRADAAAKERLLVWQTTLQAAQKAHRDAGEKLLAEAAARDTASAVWAAMLPRLGRPEGEPPAVTATVLDRLTDLDRQCREAAELSDRIDGMARIVNGFSGTVTQLAEAIGEPPVTDAFTTARALIGRRDRAAAQQSAWAQAQRNLSQAAAQLTAAEQALHAAEQARDSIVAKAGARDLDDAATRIAAARDHIRATTQRDAALATLQKHGDGLARAELQAEADTVPASAMSAARALADSREQAAGGVVEAAAIALNTLQTAYDAGTEAADILAAMAEQAAAAATYTRLLDEQLVLHVAGLLLTRAMADAETEAGDAGIARLSGVFAELTNGAYELVLDDEDGTTLLALERRFGERKTLDQLSEGTRDQLYLALRIMALRDHAASGLTLPFIADDILQTFDDARALAALRALIALSDRLQVIVLTHHDHVAALARSLGPAIHCQTLEG
jgi:uncharacterized protein YhaN